jgi:hypothetical protein
MDARSIWKKDEKDSVLSQELDKIGAHAYLMVKR